MFFKWRGKALIPLLMSAGAVPLTDINHVTVKRAGSEKAFCPKLLPEEWQCAMERCLSLSGRFLFVDSQVRPTENLDFSGRFGLPAAVITLTLHITAPHMSRGTRSQLRCVCISATRPPPSSPACSSQIPELRCCWNESNPTVGIFDVWEN